MTDRKSLIKKLEVEKQFHQSKVDALVDQIAKLRFEEAKEKYSCSCVRLNKDINVFDMRDQELRNRNGLQLGFVAETLSADRSCQTCHGSGKATEEVSK